ncbi:MAG: HD domain-containing protein [Treponema sp.]|nr:HD domain-containing protein [Treponema sp.]
MNRRIDPVLKEIALLFRNEGKEIYLVGGAVRDMLRGRKIHDWDIATNALPDETGAIIKKAGGRVIPTGIKHGTVTIFYKKHSAEITTFRTEADYSDGRRPDTVNFASTIEEDLSRRDFTMNALALRLPRGELVDPYNGENDIHKGIIRCVGDAEERFNEDGLRPLRAVRFASQLGFEIEPETLGAIPGVLDTCAKVSMERVRDETDKILSSPAPSRAFYLMENTGLLNLFLTELASCRGIEQKGFHRFDVLDHCLLACDYAAKNNYPHEVRLAALFHDIGKPVVKKPGGEGVWTFYRHENISRDLCNKLLTRLRYSNAVINKVCRLIDGHMFHYTPDWTDSAVRRFIARSGEENLYNLYLLRRADTYAFTGEETEPRMLLELQDRVEKILEKGRVFSLKDLAVSGNDLILAGMKPGKKMGVVLNQLLETVLDDPAQNTKEKLIEIAGKINCI